MDATARALRAVGRIYETALAPDAESGWMDTLRDLVGAEHAVLVRCRHGRYRWDSSRVDQALRPLVGRLVDDTIYDPVLDRIPQMRAQRLSQYLPLRDLRRNAYYNEIVRPLNGGFAASFVWGRQDARCAIAICRSAERDRDYGDGEMRLLQQALPHVRGALRVRERVGIAEAASHEADAVLDALGDGVVILDAGGAVRFVNRVARDILCGRELLTLDRRGLHAVRARDEDRLRRLLTEAERVGRTGIAEGMPTARNRIALARSGSRPPLFVTAAPAGVLPGIEASAWRPGATVVLLTDPERGRALAAEAAAAAFGLTPREAELATLLCEGGTLAEAAAGLGITAGTARQYLKSVFSKTGVHRQADLVRLFLRA